MCPLRLILIFLSATLAGFFVLKNLKSQPPPSSPAHAPGAAGSVDAALTDSPSFKFRSVVNSGFWTCVDMASGRYLLRHLASSPSSAAKSTD